MDRGAPHRHGTLAGIIIGCAGLLTTAACGGGGGGGDSTPPAVNQPPTASAGNNQTVVESAIVSLSAAGSSDSDGTIVSYSWSQVSGPDVALDSASSQVATFVGPVTDLPLALEFEVSVTDDDGARSSDTTTVTVNPNQPPVVAAGPDDQVVEGQEYTLDATVSDDDGTISSIAWQQISGPAVALSDPATEDPTFEAPPVTAITELEFELMATDSNSDVASDRVVITVEPNEPPQVTVDFPCNACRFFDSTISVAGKTNSGEDNSFVAGLDAVATLTVDAGSGPVDVPVQPDGSWLAQNVPVIPSNQSIEIRVTALDSFGESAAETVTLERKPTITSASIAVDTALPDLFYLVETTNPLPRVLSLDVSDGSFQQIYAATELLEGYEQAQSVMLRADGTSLLISTFGQGLKQVDLSTGAVSTISDDSVGAGPTLTGAISASLDADDGRVVVNNILSEEILAIDLETGNRTVVSSNTGPGSGPEFVDPYALTVDPFNDVAYVREAGDNYMSIDLTDGARTELPRDGVFSSSINSMIFDPVRSLIVAMDWFGDLVVTVDPSTGRREVLSITPADSSLRTSNALQLTYDSVGDRYVVNDFSPNISSGDSDQLLVVDPTTGTRSILYKDSLGTGPSIQGQVSIAADLDSGSLFLGSQTADSITRVNVESGERTLVSSRSLGGGPAIGTIRGLYWESESDRLYMLDGLAGSLNSVNPTSGARILLSGGLVGSGPSMALPVALKVDTAANTAYIVDEALRTIFAVDTQLGTRRIVSDDDSAGTPFAEPTGIALDVANNRLLVTDNGTGSTLSTTLYSVDISTGERTVVSAIGTGSGVNFTSVRDVELVPGRDLVVITAGDSLILVDLQTGNRSLLASSVVGNGESIENLLDIAFDPSSNRIYGWNANFEALFVYSAQTGDRVVLSK